MVPIEFVCSGYTTAATGIVPAPAPAAATPTSSVFRCLSSAGAVPVRFSIVLGFPTPTPAGEVRSVATSSTVALQTSPSRSLTTNFYRLPPVPLLAVAEPLSISVPGRVYRILPRAVPQCWTVVNKLSQVHYLHKV